MALTDDFTLTVRQISQYQIQDSVTPADRWITQQGGVGGPYRSMAPSIAVGTALEMGGFLKLAPGDGLAWNGARLIWENGLFEFSEPVWAPQLNAAGLFENGQPVATQALVEELFSIPKVDSFNGRTGNIWMDENDIRRAGGVTQNNPTHFTGMVTAPTPWDLRASSDQVATTAWVQGVIGALLCSGSVVVSFNGRGGDVVLGPDDITLAASVPGQYARASTPPLGDASTRIATTSFVDETAQYIVSTLRQEIDNAANQQLVGYAKLDSPQFTGIPTAPTASPGSSTGQLATTAFVQAAVTAATTGVSSFNTRTGAVTLQGADITAAGGALLAAPAFTGNPTATTQAPGDNSTRLATTAFVHAAVAGLTGGVSSFNTRTGAVTLVTADITAAGGAPLASPALTGTPTAPTATAGTSTTQLATTAFVQAAVSGAAGVASFNGRTGVVTLAANDISAAGGAPVASPVFTGTPAAPTAAPGTSTTQLATTAFVQAALSAGGVTTFNGRSGAVTLTSSDVTTAGGAPLASPAFSGTPTAPNPAPGTNNTQIATTSFVMSVVGGSIVSTFNGRSGAVTLTTGDITGAGGAALASPAFTGTPTAPTPAPGTNSGAIATTSYVQIAIAGAVTAFNGRTGSVTLSAADISAAGGALLAGPAFTGTPTAPTATTGTATNQLATCQFVLNELGTLGGVTTFNGRAGNITLTSADLTSAGGALLASPTFTGTPAAPTAAPGTSSTQLATTAFVAAAIAGFAPLASPAFTGVPTAPTPVTTDNSTALATTAFVKASQAAAASGSLVLISKQTVSSPVAAVAFNNVFNATYNKYALRFTGMTFSATAVIWGQFSSNGGSSWVATGYSSALFFVLSNNTGNYAGGAGTQLILSLATDPTAGYSMSGEYMIYNTRNGALNKVVRGDCATIASSGMARSMQASVLAATAVVDSIQFTPSTGNFTAGTIELFGVIT